MTPTQELRGRSLTHQEARDACRRLINSHFHNDDRDRCSIPPSPSDDDLALSDYLIEVDVARTEGLAVLKQLAQSREFALHIGADSGFGSRVLRHLWANGVEPKTAHLPAKPAVGQRKKKGNTALRSRSAYGR